MTFADSDGEATVQNDDSATVSIADVIQDEGDFTTTSFTFTVSLSNEVDARRHG